MKRKTFVPHWRSWLLALLMAVPASLAAQDPGNDAPAIEPAPARCGFGAATQAHARARVQLGVTRGAPVERPPTGPTQAARPSQVPSETEIVEWLAGRVAEGTYPAGTHVLFYAHRGGELAAWLIGPGGIAACGSQPVSAQAVSSQVSDLMGALQIQERQLARTARPIGEEAARSPAPPALDAGTAWAISDATAQLSRALFPPAIVPALAEVRHLVIVPTGELGTIPYPALSPWGDGTQIVDRFSVSVAPSLHSLARPVPRWNASEAFARPLIVGDPRLPPATGWQIPPLPGAEAEAREVARMMNAPAIVGAAATRETVSNRAGSASLLYVATHGIANPDDPVDGGFLMLAAQSFESGWWTARTIQASRLDARLAVLSACQTGLGQAHEGGMIGLARAFQLAGVPRVLMSLWNVDDEATRFLMVRFMRHARRHPPAEALRRSMIEARREFEHPALWASFLLFSEAA